MKSEDLKTSAYHHPVFKGLGRKPTFMGIPTTWFLCTVSVVAFMAMLFGLIWWTALLVVLPTMAIITKTDDRAFDVWILELKTRGRNRNKAFWGGSSYAPTTLTRRIRRNHLE